MNRIFVYAENTAHESYDAWVQELINNGATPAEAHHQVNAVRAWHNSNAVKERKMITQPREEKPSETEHSA